MFQCKNIANLDCDKIMQIIIFSGSLNIIAWNIIAMIVIVIQFVEKPNGTAKEAD